MATKVLTNKGRNAIRDFLAAEVTELAVGTDGTDASKTETTLGNEVISKTVETAEDTGIGEERFTIRLSSAEANGYDLAELGAKNDGGTVLSRLVFAEIAKSSDFEVEFRLTKTVQNPQ